MPLTCGGENLKKREAEEFKKLEKMMKKENEQFEKFEEVKNMN